MAQTREEDKEPAMYQSDLSNVTLSPPRDYVAMLPAAIRVTMGLHPLDLAEWIEVDDRLPDELAEKRRLLAERRDDVLRIMPAAAAGARETLALLSEHLPRRYPQIYRQEGARLANRATGEIWDLAADDLHPLELASRLVQEDLCLMGREDGDDRYRLTGACVCFPTRWRMPEKLGRSLNAIHEPVPHYDPALTSPMDRLFARLPVERPMWRLNVSILDSPALFQPGGHQRAAGEPPITAQNAGDSLWLRMERQTLRRLPQSGDILFTIRVYSRPLGALAGRPERAERLAAVLRGVDAELAAYKGIEPVRTAAITWLERAAGRAGGAA